MFKFLLIVLLFVSCSSTKVNVEKIEEFPFDSIYAFRRFFVEYDESFNNTETLCYLEERLNYNAETLKSEKVGFPYDTKLELNKFDAFLILYSYITIHNKLDSQFKEFILTRIEEDPSHFILELYVTCLIDYFEIHSRGAFNSLRELKKKTLKSVIRELIEKGNYDFGLGFTD